MRDGSQLERRAQDGGAGRGPVRLVVAAVFAALAMHALGCAGTEEVTGPDRSRAEECTRPPCGDRGSGRTLCDPPCATGTACVEGVCIEDCNPPCSPGYHCTAERVCAPDSTPDAGDVDPVDARPGDVPAVLDVAAEVDARGSSDLPPPRDTAAEDEEESCALATLTAENRVLPADIVLVIDTSGSMDQEEETVEDKLPFRSVPSDNPSAS